MLWFREAYLIYVWDLFVRRCMRVGAPLVLMLLYARQIEDRIKKLFAVWAEWSVFPTLYLVGLQATFYMNTSERSAMKEYVQREAEAEALDGVSVGAAAVGMCCRVALAFHRSLCIANLGYCACPYCAAEAEALEQLRKRARLCAVPHTDKTSRHELQFRLDHAERYLRTKYGDSGAAAISTLLAPIQREERPSDSYMPSESGAAAGGAYDDDIDGVPLDVAQMTPLERMLQQQIEDTGGADTMGGYDDDIDGVPINLAEYSIPISGDLPPHSM
jgi:hypothetical protein